MWRYFEILKGKMEMELTRTVWGRWKYKPSNNTLTYREPKYKHWAYEIDLDECTDAAEVLDWLFHMKEKVWLSPTQLGNLVCALKDILGYRIERKEGVECG